MFLTNRPFCHAQGDNNFLKKSVIPSKEGIQMNFTEVPNFRIDLRNSRHAEEHILS